MLAIRFTNAAESDLTEAKDWYARENEDLSVRFLAEVRHQLERIRDSHLQFPLIRRKARRARLNTFPYSIVFQVRDNVAYIVAIFHFSRSPSVWRRRL